MPFDLYLLFLFIAGWRVLTLMCCKMCEEVYWLNCIFERPILNSIFLILWEQLYHSTICVKSIWWLISVIVIVHESVQLYICSWYTIFLKFLFVKNKVVTMQLNRPIFLHILEDIFIMLEFLFWQCNWIKNIFLHCNILCFVHLLSYTHSLHVDPLCHSNWFKWKSLQIGCCRL